MEGHVFGASEDLSKHLDLGQTEFTYHLWRDWNHAILECHMFVLYDMKVMASGWVV